MTREETIQGLENIESRAIDFPYMTASDWVAIAAAKRHLTNSIEVKEVGMSVLDNGNMPIERWKEACEAASCQANYRKSKGLTETCDDYFVDGVQWADEHPINNDLVKELDYDDYMAFFKEHPEYSNGDWGFEETWTFGQYCYTLGLKAQKGD